MPTVVHVSQPVEEGVGHQVAAVCAGLARRDWDVAVVSPNRGLWATEDPPLWSRLRASGVTIHEWRATRAPGPNLPREVRDLARMLRRLSPDLVHLHSAKAGLAGRLIRPIRPIVFQPHAWSFEAGSRALRAGATAWERWAASKADAIVCVSEAERARGLEAGLSANWSVIPNGVDLQAWRAAGPEERPSARDALGLTSEGPIAVCVGRLSRQKGQDVLIRAWERVVGEVPEARLFLVGEGPERVTLQRRAGHGIRFVGNRNDVPTWLAAADVVVLPSRWEGMSLAMLEAMARGRSVVSTDVAGAREALGSQAGEIVPVEDIEALAGAVVRRLVDPELANREGDAARMRAEARFNMERVLDQFEALYAKLLQQPGDQA